LAPIFSSALGHKRLRRTPAGEVVLQLKTPYRDGTTHLVMSPLEFLQRLAALVPRLVFVWPLSIFLILAFRKTRNRKLHKINGL
jgi:hypothetical protein